MAVESIDVVATRLRSALKDRLSPYWANVDFKIGKSGGWWSGRKVAYVEAYDRDEGVPSSKRKLARAEILLGGNQVLQIERGQITFTSYRPEIISEKEFQAIVEGKPGRNGIHNLEAKEYYKY